MMRCDPEILTAYVDGALSRGASLQMARHMASCPECARTAEEHRALKRRLARHAAAVVLPAGLASRVSSALDSVAAPPPSAPPFALPAPGKAGIGLTVATVITGAGLWFARPIWQPKPVDVQAIMSVHRHAINPPADATLRTNNPVTGAAWAQSRLEETPALPAVNLPLRAVGVCHVGGMPAAIWMYQSREPVSLIEIYGRQQIPDWAPAPGCATGSEMRAGTFGGYNAVVWRKGKRTYALVSRLPHRELQALLPSR